MAGIKKAALIGAALMTVAILWSSVTAASAGSTTRDRWGRTVDAATRLAPAAGVPTGTTVSTITLQAVDINEYGYLDLGEPGDSVGDTSQFRNLVKDPTTNQILGDIQVQCTEAYNFAFICNGRISLTGRGQLAIYGEAADARAFSLAEVGGTGEFAGRNGQMNVAIGKMVETYTITLYA